MVGAFLHKLLGRAPQPAAIQPALAELDALCRTRPALTVPAGLLADVLAVLFGDAIRERAPAISRDLASGKLAKGVPLLRWETVDIDRPSFARRWQAVARAIQRHQNDDAALAVSRIVHDQHFDVGQLVSMALEGHPAEVRELLEQQGIDVALAVTVLRLALYPVLVSIREQWTPLRQFDTWSRGYCPLCGSWPLLGEFRGLEQTRFLRCGLCAAAWPFARLCCPFCDCADHRRLGFLAVEGEESRARVAICERCRGYVKTIATLSGLDASQLLVSDLATTHFDLIAGQRGYAPPS